MEKTNCFAHRGNYCNALNTMICKEQECPFYKGDNGKQYIRSEMDILRYSSTRGIHKGVV